MKSYKRLVNSLNETDQARSLSDEELLLIKEIMFNCYLDIARVCQEHNITVMLGGGTALGAVRHNGYIPWDDDFDMLMLREDYERFEEIFDQYLGEKYILRAPNYRKSTVNRYPRIFIKGTEYVALGEDLKSDANQVRLDLFIVENIPDNWIIRNLRGFICTALMFIAGRVGTSTAMGPFLSQTKEGKREYMRRRFIGKVFSFWTFAKWCDMIDRVCHYRKDSNRLGIPTGRKHYWGEIFEKHVFLPVSEGVFEGAPVNLPNDADAYLKNLYGNYMTLPPENEREKHYVVKFNIAGS